MEVIATGHKWDCLDSRGRVITTKVLMDNLRFRGAHWEPEHKGWNIHNSDLKELLDIQGKYPTTGLGPYMLGNVVVYLMDTPTVREYTPGKTRPHRMFAICPNNDCAAHVPAGRLFQHKCKP